MWPDIMQPWEDPIFFVFILALTGVTAREIVSTWEKYKIRRTQRQATKRR